MVPLNSFKTCNPQQADPDLCLVSIKLPEQMPKTDSSEMAMVDRDLDCGYSSGFYGVIGLLEPARVENDL